MSNKTSGNRATAGSTQYLTYGGIIAALYVILTMIANAVGLASGAIQVRLSEALCLLPCLTPAAVPGLFIGCVLANLITGCAPWDVVFGSLATLIGAVGTRLMRNKPGLSWIPPVLSNAIIVPFVLMWVYGVNDVEVTVPFTETVIAGSGFWPLMLTVGIGEVISVVLLGRIVYQAAIRAGIPGLSRS